MTDNQTCICTCHNGGFCQGCNCNLMKVNNFYAPEKFTPIKQVGCYKDNEQESESTLELKQQISELQASQREILKMIKDVRSESAGWEQHFSVEIRDRLHRHDKRIGNLESEVKCNMSGITYNSKRIDALEEASTEKFAHPNIIGRIEHMENYLCGKKYIEGLGNLSVNVMDVKDLSPKTIGLTFIEALIAMSKGKQIKRKDWCGGSGWSENELIINRVDYRIDSEYYLATDWEIVE